MRADRIWVTVNNEIATTQDIPRIATLLRRHNVLFDCDAAQAPCDWRDQGTLPSDSQPSP